MYSKVNMACFSCASSLELNKNLNLKVLVFHTKMRAFLWCKTVKDDVLLSEENWCENLMDFLGSHRFGDQSLAVWIPPKEGLVEFNVDEATKEGFSGCRRVL
ncbi:hypothetical protein V6N13_016840 [Hibiscus sabdariffa]